MVHRVLLIAALFISGVNRLLPLPTKPWWKWIPNEILACSCLLAVFFLYSNEPTAAITAAAWWPITLIVRQVWYTPFIKWNCLRHGGPLGPGCSKVVEVVVGVVLWLCAARGEVPYLVLPATIDQHGRVDFTESSRSSLMKVAAQLGVIVVFSLVVFQVLRLWSKLTKSTGDHKGVQDMVAQQGRDSLVFRDHVRWMALALINATAEEYTSRGLWREEFQLTGQLSRGQSNVAQALIFGAWHFHGIPSGWTGVVLTTVYGWIMGCLSDWTGGSLVAPIVSHTLVDYFIFTVIVQKKKAKD